MCVYDFSKFLGSVELWHYCGDVVDLHEMRNLPVPSLVVLACQG